LFVHCAGTLDALGSVASGLPVATSCAGCRSATMVVCSGPSATQAIAGMSHHCGKAALEHWTRTIGAELGEADSAPRVFSVVPYCVDTPRLREMVSTSPEDVPAAALFADGAGRGGVCNSC
jgi:benzil reductase ((S)-benzoin forming)